ncbi:MAG: hypothetical protein JSS75_12025 [Bacteroidetes bacterium]|nr:hypothetical protein [Bacteroidota bacterium]
MQLLVFVLLVACASGLVSAPRRKPSANYIPPRPAVVGLHVAMPADSAIQIMHKIAMRTRTLKVDSLSLLESDSVRVFGEPAYLRLEMLHNRVRTIVVNFHPLSGDHYLNLRSLIPEYLERSFGRGVITKDQSVVYRRWENEDGTMEVSYTDKYLRVFMRLGKR